MPELLLFAVMDVTIFGVVFPTAPGGPLIGICAFRARFRKLPAQYRPRWTFGFDFDPIIIRQHSFDDAFPARGANTDFVRSAAFLVQATSQS